MRSSAIRGLPVPLSFTPLQKYCYYVKIAHFVYFHIESNYYLYAMIGGKKIINDPVHGFIDIPYGLVFNIIEHPYVQRLREIKQLGMTHLVYPGACHTRFAHALGSMHLMREAINSLRSKDVPVSGDEETAACIAMLLHDVGHGPFSHALEGKLITSIGHEEISLELMDRINREMDGAISDSISIFTGEYPKMFLHQLVSGELDVDRLDYLTRDSFYSGVAEGMIGLERIIQMLTVRDGRLIIEAKGVHSIEKFLISRRMMYWQVYLHKTVIAAERLMANILKRAREMIKSGENLEMSGQLRFLLENGDDPRTDRNTLLDVFVKTDDSDVLYSIKQWAGCKDRVLSELSRNMCERRLPKVEFSNGPLSEEKTLEMKSAYAKMKKCSMEDIDYYFSTGTVENKGYNSEEAILILNKDGSTGNIYEISDMLSAKAFSCITKKYFICRTI